MADAAGKSYPVRAIYEFFKHLEGQETQDGRTELNAFLAECDEKNLSLVVGKELFDVGHEHYNRMVHPEAVGPDCPLCPSPARG